MSLDLVISNTPCKSCGHSQETQEFNYTYNVSPMWYKIYPGDDGMVQIEGLTGNEAIHKISWVVDNMENDPEYFKQLNPDNGWGSYDGFLLFLKQLEQACIDMPNGIWSAAR